jgi:hypothetical protein
VVHAGKLIEARRARPSRVFEALSKLPAVYVPLDLDDDDPPRAIQADNVYASTVRQIRLSGDAEDRFAEKLVRVRP